MGYALFLRDGITKRGERVKAGKTGGDWNPWHGCTKISPGCKHCYVYRQDEMYGEEKESSVCRKTQSFNLPIKRTRDGSFKIPSGSIVFTCFTSDFLLADADGWRSECWEMIKKRSDCAFYFFTKRIERLPQCLPPDWGDGYDNVLIGCTAENQEYADKRLPIFLDLPIKHRSIIAAPLLGKIDFSPYLCEKIDMLSVGGESGTEARVCDYSWVLDIRRQCVEAGVSFRFHQTGARFLKDGKLYKVRRPQQILQAKKAGIDYLLDAERMPEGVLPKLSAEFRDDITLEGY